jgi:hypothetical protein
MPQKQHARQLGADRAGLDDCVTAESRPLLSQNNAVRQAAELRLRRQRQVELICETPRLVAELLEEIGRHHGIADDIDARLAARFLDPRRPA